MKWKDGRIGQLFIYCAILVIFILAVLCLVFLTSSSARAQSIGTLPKENLCMAAAWSPRVGPEQVSDSGERVRFRFLAAERNGIENPDANQLLNDKVLQPPPEIKRKSLVEAGLLGGLLGYGTGQYYTKRKVSGTAFLIADVLCTAAIAGGFAIAATEPNSFEDLFAHMAGSLYLIEIGGIGLIGSHVVQAIWGPIAANKYNKALPRIVPPVPPPVDPIRSSAQ